MSTRRAEVAAPSAEDFASVSGSSLRRRYAARIASVRPPLAAAGDGVLIELIAAGDNLALGELYDRFGAVAYGLALRVLRDPGLAEDAVQNAFLSVWRSARSFNGNCGAPRSWLLTLVHRRAVDLVRRESAHSEKPTAALPELESPPASEEAVRVAQRHCVQSALESLPRKQRTVLELAYYGGYTQGEIAIRLGVPLGTVKSRMFDGLASLRKVVREEELGSCP